jgi:large subunit ribosomal protein L6
MSRIGKKIIIIPEGVNVSINNQNILVKGPKGELSLEAHNKINVKSNDGQIKVERATNDKLARSVHGLTRTLIMNMIEGVSKGYEKKLELKGVGYRASVQGSKLTLLVGYSHPVIVDAPEGISFQVQKNIIVISGINKELVGETAAKIRKIRKPEPYKGKGIKYIDEVIRRKPGKTAKASSGQGA